MLFGTLANLDDGLGASSTPTLSTLADFRTAALAFPSLQPFDASLAFLDPDLSSGSFPSLKGPYLNAKVVRRILAARE
jgi:hypothetical protein